MEAVLELREITLAWLEKSIWLQDGVEIFASFRVDMQRLAGMCAGAFLLLLRTYCNQSI